MDTLDDISAVMELLVEELEGVIDALRQQGAAVLARGDYRAATEAIEEAKRVETFLEKVKELKREWQEGFRLTNHSPPRERSQPQSHARNHGAYMREHEYRMPILEAIEELGGRAEAGKVLDLVYEKVRPRLSDHDLQPLSRGELRWRRTAEWCRYRMTREGLLNPNSPYGIWEITDRGRAALARLKGMSD